MKLLLIDTCGVSGSVALADTSPKPSILATVALPGRTASERLVAAIRDLAANNGSTLQSLDAIVVVSGPGSFTGVRVGLSAAKGLCEALGLPLIAVSRLAVLSHSASLPQDAPAFALLDAGRGEVYLRISNGLLPPTESLVTRDQLLTAFESRKASPTSKTQPTLIACEPYIAESFADLSPLLLREPTAADALPLAMLRIEARDFDDIATIDANYLRRTDAEIFASRATASMVAP